MDKNWSQVVQECFKILEKNGYEVQDVIFLYLTGSRLYGIHTEDSDYDMIAYVLPTKTDLYNAKTVSKQYSDKENKFVEHLVVKDIRDIPSKLEKMGYNSLHFFEKPFYIKNDLDSEEIFVHIKNNIVDYVLLSAQNFVMSLLGTRKSYVKVLDFSNDLLDKKLKEKARIHSIDTVLSDFMLLSEGFDFGYFSKKSSDEATNIRTNTEYEINKEDPFTKEEFEGFRRAQETDFEDSPLKKFILEMIIRRVYRFEGVGL